MSMKWYAHHIGDYAKDTSRLSMLEHGAYRLLLDEYYGSGAPLPSDIKNICRVCRASTRTERAAIVSVLGRFFVIESDGLYHNKRADREIEKANKISSERSEAARIRHANAHANAGANAEVLQPVCNTQPQPQPQPQKERKEDKSSFQKKEDVQSHPMPTIIFDEPEEKKNVRKRATRLPDDWQPNVSHMSKCSTLGLDCDDLANGLNGFRNYHGSKGSLFIDWDKAFFTWIGNAQRFGAERQQRSSAQRSDVRDVTGAALRAAENIRKKRDCS